MPHVVPICYVFHEGVIYSSVDEKPKRTKPAGLRRIINIQENPNVCVVIDHYEDDWRRLRFIIVHGKAKLLQSGKEYQQAINQLRKKYPQYRFMNLQTRPLIKILPTKMRTWRSETRYRPPERQTKTYL
jgi:PPOX class probable F420-dependent enzyme